MRGRSPFANEDAQSKRARSRLFQSLNFPQTNQRRELVAIARNSIGGSGSSFHRAFDYLRRDFLESRSEFDSFLRFDWHLFSVELSGTAALGCVGFD